MVKEQGCQGVYQATLLHLLHDKDPNTPQSKDPTLLLHTAQGFKVMPVSRIEQLTFVHEPHEDVVHAQKKGGLSLQLAGDHVRKTDRVRVGMAYVQKGRRWSCLMKMSMC